MDDEEFPNDYVQLMQEDTLEVHPTDLLFVGKHKFRAYATSEYGYKYYLNTFTIEVVEFASLNTKLSGFYVN